MKLSEDQAKEIMKVFGPCTTLYECVETAELVQKAEGFKSVPALLSSLLEAEALFLGQRGEQWSGENEVEFKAAVAEDKAFLRDLKDRVQAYRIQLDT